MELTYPSNEEVSSTLLTNGANLTGMLFILALAPLLTADMPRLFLAILAAFNVLGCGLLVFMRPRYKRLMAEQEVRTQLNSIDGSELVVVSTPSHCSRES